MDVLEVLASGMIRSGGGGTQPRPASSLGVLWMPSFSFLAALPITIKGPLDVSLDGDDTTQPCHLQDQIGIMRDYHELGESVPKVIGRVI
jgi:hypothetical protein